MTDTNHVILIGRLTRDLGADERSYTILENGSVRANVSIAVNRSVKKGEEWIDEVSYFDVTIWGKTAENLKPYLTKGKQICVDGYLKQDRWEKDGQKMSKISIVSNNVQLLGNKGDGNNQAASSGVYSQSVNGNTQDDNGEFPEDIPF